MQSNQTVNDHDNAYQSRQIFIQFGALQDDGEGDDPNMFVEWNAIRELSSALAPDLASILWHGKLDREAIQDCAQFLQSAIGKKRDRNTNLWGILLYYMLVINFLLQGDQRDVENVFSWMIDSVTGMAYELNQHASEVDKFVIAVSKLRADGGTSGISNPLGPMDATIFWDKLRNTRDVSGVEHLCVRLEPVVAVLNKVLKTNFKPAVLKQAIGKCGWATTGRVQFYDATTNPWPICRTDCPPGDMAPTKIPLSEEEAILLGGKAMECVKFRLDKVDDIISGIDTAKAHAQDYRGIEIDSARRETGRYNFYSVVTGVDTEGVGWYGYRAAGHTPYSAFCGIDNMLSMHDPQIKESVETANVEAGCGSVHSCFEPRKLVEAFSYEQYEPENGVPPAYAFIPFLARDGEGDVPIPHPVDATNHEPAVELTNEYPAENYSPKKVAGAGEVGRVGGRKRGRAVAQQLEEALAESPKVSAKPTAPDPEVEALQVEHIAVEVHGLRPAGGLSLEESDEMLAQALASANGAPGTVEESDKLLAQALASKNDGYRARKEH